MAISKNHLIRLQNYFFPPTCILCGNSGFDLQDICSPCFTDLHRNLHCCYRCAGVFNSASDRPRLCGVCISKPPAFDSTYAPFIHQGSMRFLIARLKFNRQYKHARLLAYLLADYLEKTAETPDLIIPVPLHKKRYKERGFNQSVEIAKTLSKRLKIPLDFQTCIRSRNTPHQIDLPAKLRLKNMKNAFVVSKPIDVQHVAILDDVITTGSTVNELAKVLKKAGVSRVDVWGCARAAN